MTRLRAMSIRSMVTLAILAPTLSITSVGLSLVAGRTVDRMRVELEERAAQIADVVGRYSVPDLAFGTRRESVETLAGLVEDPEIEMAALYDKGGALFSSHVGGGAANEPSSTLPTMVPVPGAVDREAAIDVYRELLWKGERYGTILLRVSTVALDQRVDSYRAMIAILAFSLIGMAVLFALLLQGVIAPPVLRLAEAASRIAGGGDYSLRVDVTGGAREVSVLSDGFNRMLAAIQDRQRQRDEAEAALRGEKERLAVTLRSIGDAVVTTDTGGRVLLMNRVAETWIGIAADEAAGRPLAEVLELRAEKTLQPRGDVVARVLGGGEEWLCAEACVLVGRKGRSRIVAVAGSVIRDPDSRPAGVVLALRDETERRRMEQEIGRAEKLEAVGVLAGGIAHDFNNILTGVLGRVSLARAPGVDASAVDDHLAEAEVALVRARDLTMQLLTFAKGGMPIRKAASVADLIVDSAQFALRGANVRCEFEIPADTWPVDVDAAQISRVVQNIVLNASQAMPGGGVVRVSAANEARRPHPAAPAQPNDNRWVRVSVSDSGVGIRPEDLDRIFDPWFTTKPGGTGLGLATCHSIVRNHGGHIRVESKVGEGTTFHVYLPAAVAAAVAEPGGRNGEGTPLAEGTP
ncbi:MAG: PAS domain S-box protein, partial [Deltaproteobacteria bacterium]|nr:PAS domain S-box protein [Deltaproteobacteria bacterium]